MKSFPMFIRTTGRHVVIVGGGEEAAQKTRLILKTDAHIILAAQNPEPELADLIAKGRVTWHRAAISPELFQNAVMGFVATGCPGLDASVQALAKAARCPVNVVDQPHLCDLTTPSLVDRDPVVVAIGTEGTAPVLARQIKTKVEEILSPNLGDLAALAGRLRTTVAQHIARENRRSFWRWVFAEAPRTLWTRGAENEATRAIKNAIQAGRAPRATQTGSLALVGAGPGAKDLLTMRAVARLQEADVIYYDRLVDPDVLELARRDAERVYVGKVVGASAWPQEKINALIVQEARKGRNVVRLKSGDPGIFGRAGEEIAAARSAGVPVEVVPGVTAACAAGAAAGQSLTERNVTSALVLAAATGVDGRVLRDSLRFTAPGTSTVFYMATRQSAAITTALMERGLPADAPVLLAANVSKPNEAMIPCTVATLAQTVQSHAVSGCAVVLVSWPKSAAQSFGTAAEAPKPLRAAV